MTIAAISDLHGFLIDNIKPCDLIIICGDLVSLDAQASSPRTRKWFLYQFKPWCEKLPCNKVIFIAGNHDLHIRKEMPWVQENFSKSHKVTYLENEFYEYENLKIFGTPYCKIFGKWAFMCDNPTLEKMYSEIPYDLDILITHDAPYGCSDVSLEFSTKHLGNIPLRDSIIEKKPKYCLHGHLHSSNHEFETLGNTLVTNCSILNENYQINYNPIYLWKNDI